MNAVVTVLVFAIVFAQIYLGTLDRRTAVLLGGGVMAVYGMAAGFMTPGMVVSSIYFEVLALIFGMSAVSSVLARSGLFALIANRTVAHSRGNGWWVLVSLSLATYGLSLTVNNLATMVVVLPVTLAVCRQMKLNPVPLIVAEIIASNLGGASTMIGDFPNMIIASVGRLRFIDFIGGMMPPCLALLAVMLVYFQSRRAEFETGADPARVEWSGGIELREPAVDRRLMKAGLSILGMTLVGFVFTDAIGVRPGWIAVMAGALAISAVDRGEKMDWFAACGGSDILFFVGLFVMVGGLVAAGVLDGVLWLLAAVGGGLPTMLTLMWVAALVTMFLNAGAATAFLVPVAAGIYAGLGDPAVWWALSLGVLAGSSAALTAATAGPVAASHLDRFVEAHPDMQQVMAPGARLDAGGYLRWGMPVMGMFLVLSSFYIAIVSK